MDRSKAPPSPLGFKLMLVVPGRIKVVKFYQCLGLSIVGYLIPVCDLAFVGSGQIKPPSWLNFLPPDAYDSFGGVRL